VCEYFKNVKPSNPRFVINLRNKSRATSVALYSIRAREGVPVSLPVDWKELPKLESGSQFDLQSTIRRINKDKPWRAMAETKESDHKIDDQSFRHFGGVSSGIIRFR